ncbi:MAG: hypothetical protein Q7T42_12755, partial [Methylotenera sp.]|uniref:hypothetical protein n=1 Tax=Methylotenera sp. TaxID=2051956 RepID=UPI00271772B8|nr:hypothetical protein [Methylotenera sp.]
MKKKLLALAMAVGFISNVYASEALVATSPSTMDAMDIQAAFKKDKQPLQLATLSVLEMKETEGALLPLAVVLVGAGTSAWGYHGISYYNSGGIGTSAGAARAAGLGAFSSIGFGAGLAGVAGVTNGAAYLGLRGLVVNAALQKANVAYSNPTTSAVVPVAPVTPSVVVPTEPIGGGGGGYMGN